MKKVSIVLYALTMVLAMSTGLMAAGTEPTGNPRQVSTLDHLLWISTNSSSWGDDFIQTADIDASTTTTWNYNGSTYEGFSPIGNITTSFTGTYDGLGHTIDALFIDRDATNYIGLFGYTNGATFENIGVTDVNFTGRAYIGGLVALIQASSTVSNCYSTGVVNGSNVDVGGLVGYSNNSSEVSNSHSTVSVSGQSYAGGLVGNNNSSTVSNSYSTGSVSGTSQIGGFIGRNSSSSTVSKSYSTGSVSGTSYVGGLVGVNSSSTVSNCYSTGDVTRSSGTDINFGGFCAYNSSTIEYCYSIGDVTYTGAADPTDKGFVGLNDGGTSPSSFWDSEASNQSTSGGGTGKTTAEMKDIATFTNTATEGLTTAWDFPGTLNDDAGSDDYWDMDISNGLVNDGYPYLITNLPTESATPITLASFTAEVKNGVVALAWETASETNNASFVIYRNDEVLARVEGAGTTSETNNYVYVDAGIIPGVTYTYVLADMDYANTLTRYDNKAITLTVGNTIAEVDFVIGAAYPNPFNPTAVVPVELSRDAVVNAKVYTLTGREIATLVNGTMNAGSHELHINANNMTTGLYLVKVVIENVVDVQKIAFVK